MNQCPLCQEQTKEKGICGTCADIIEFGYPSFPAYMLETVKIEEKPCGCGDSEHDHTQKLLSVS
ncbi:hypothetical protein [Brevibacillus migulae]|uniref:hypothetical protein n=1 Tax=Brevibacillus migulae TaxID=1644114 RepID=UPI00106E6F4C|nr:hypothetical protein [Brevibacillus migulae]